MNEGESQPNIGKDGIVAADSITNGKATFPAALSLYSGMGPWLQGLLSSCDGTWFFDGTSLC